MVNNKRIAKNTLFLYFRMLIVMGISLYTSRIVLRALGVVDYGLYNVVGGVITMLSCLSGSLGGATSRYITFELGRKDYVRLNKTFNVALVVHVFIALMIVVLAETIGLWFMYNKMEIPAERLTASLWVYQFSVVAAFVRLIQVPYDALIIAHENMKIYAYTGLAEVIAKLMVVYMLAISPIDKLVFYALLLCLVQVALRLFYRFYCSKHYAESKFSPCREKELYKSIFTYAGSDLIGSLSVMAQGQGLNILLNMFFGPVVNAARGIAYQVQAAVTQFSSNFMTAVRPQVIKSYAEGDVKSMWKLVEQSGCFSFYLLWMICLPIILEADTILHIWLGAYPEHSVNFLRLILVLCLVQSLKTPRTMVFHAMAKVFWANITAGITLCLAFPLAYIFLRCGMAPESVFWASIITMISSELVSTLVLRCFLRFSVIAYFMKVHIRCMLIAGISLVGPYLLFDRYMDAGFPRLVVTCVMATISVSLTALYIGMNRSTRGKLYTIARNKLCNRK
ncbi:MAG: lipopolysaccharide biosynthesis protein [Prevotella sp.]|nr:lipopolysaccharide biosynthesis protein [Prevotella sp.]